MKILEIHNFINEGGPIIEIVEDDQKYLGSEYTIFWENYSQNIPKLISYCKRISKWSNNYFRIIKMQELEL